MGESTKVQVWVACECRGILTHAVTRSGHFKSCFSFRGLTVKLTKPWTPEIFVEFYCVARNKPIRREITKPQTGTVICLWFWGLLAYPELCYDWPVPREVAPLSSLASTQSTFLKFFRCSQFSGFESSFLNNQPWVQFCFICCWTS